MSTAPSQLVDRPGSRDEFLLWVEHQEGRWEFDGARPVAMMGGTLGHSVVIGNIVRHLGDRLFGRLCRLIGPDAAVATPGGAVRYPDAVVTCAGFQPFDRLVPDPVVVFEVVSPTSVRNDRVTKVREYAAVPSIRRYVLVEAETVTVTVLSRDGGDELFRDVGLSEGDVVPLPEIGAELPVADIYDGVLPAPDDGG